MKQDRITQLRVSGLRAIRDLTLNLNGLTVLIGDNGSGKSTILEALEILRLASQPLAHAQDVLDKKHGGFQSLLRHGADELRLGVTIEGAGPRIDYDFGVAMVGTHPLISFETLDVHVPGEAARDPFHVLLRSGQNIRIFDVEARKLTTNPKNDEGDPISVGDQALALGWLGVKAQPAIQRVIDALEGAEVHAPFETRPLWQQRELDIREGPRWPALLERTDRLTRFAKNLPVAFHELHNNRDKQVWSRVLERARLGLGPDFREFRTVAFGRGQVELQLVFGAFPDHPMPVELLSDGQVSYLAFIALCELHSNRSLLAFDEPELHLHPALLSRVVYMLEDVAQTAPVILATHSDRLLDAIEDPASAVVLCDLDEERAVRLRRPDQERLAEWLEDYRGLGSIRAEGYESHVFTAAARPSEKAG